MSGTATVVWRATRRGVWTKQIPNPSCTTRRGRLNYPCFFLLPLFPDALVALLRQHTPRSNHREIWLWPGQLVLFVTIFLFPFFCVGLESRGDVSTETSFSQAPHEQSIHMKQNVIIDSNFYFFCFAVLVEFVFFFSFQNRDGFS